MFTGIVQTQAQVIFIKTVENLSRITICLENDFIRDLQTGASIAINGVCLTVVEFGLTNENIAEISFDVIAESLKVTNLGNLSVNDHVNFERSLKVGDEIGGHQVSGHVHCQASLTERIETNTNCTLNFECEDSDWLKYVLPKGFITINGTSLTVGDVTKNGFNVHLIPETLTRTNLGTLIHGDRVNLEFDQQTITIVTTIERMKITA